MASFVAGAGADAVGGLGVGRDDRIGGGGGGVAEALTVGSKSSSSIGVDTGARESTEATDGAVRAALISASSFFIGVYEVPTGTCGVGFCLEVIAAISGRPMGL